MKQIKTDIYHIREISYYTLKKEQYAVKMEQLENKNELKWIKIVKAGLKETWRALSKKSEQYGKIGEKIQQKLRTSLNIHRIEVSERKWKRERGKKLSTRN